MRIVLAKGKCNNVSLKVSLEMECDGPGFHCLEGNEPVDAKYTELSVETIFQYIVLVPASGSEVL